MMKKIALTLALADLAATPLLAQPSRRVAPVPGAHNVEGELVLFGNANFTGTRQVVTRESANAGTPFAVRSLSLRPGDRWQICAGPNFRAPCTTLSRPISDATMIGITGQVGSARLLVDPNAAN